MLLILMGFILLLSKSAVGERVASTVPKLVITGKCTWICFKTVFGKKYRLS